MSMEEIINLLKAQKADHKADMEEMFKKQRVEERMREKRRRRVL